MYNKLKSSVVVLYLDKYFGNVKSKANDQIMR